MSGLQLPDHLTKTLAKKPAKATSKTAEKPAKATSKTAEKPAETTSKTAEKPAAMKNTPKKNVRPTSAAFLDTSSEPEIRLTARVPQSFKTRVKVMCAQDNITVSAYITNLIEADLKKRGLM